MASETPLGDSTGESFAALPAFFTNGSVDDSKYESLLADLRAHDLLGPVEDAGAGSSASAFGGGSGGSSLFFNDAFSAVFMGNFSDSAGNSAAFGSASTTTATAKSSSSKAPPPGFARAPPGLAPSETDLKWARGQEEFSRLEEKFHSHGPVSTTSTNASVAVAPSPAAVDKDGDLQIDESQIPSLRSLGLDDDDAAPEQTVAPKHRQETMAWQQSPSVPEPLMPHQIPPPGMAGGPPMPPPPPTAWQAPPNGHQPGHPYPPMSGMPPHQMQGPQPPMPPPPHFAHGHPGMPPPPHGMPYPPPPPFFMGPPPPQQFGRGGPMPSPGFKMMTPRDINFVIQQQMKWVRTSDPFSDDYYFHNYVQKRTRGAPTGGPGGRPNLPLPSWKLEHVKSFDPRDAQRAQKSRDWESEYHVLGRNAKSSLYRPRQALNLGADAPPSSTPSSEASAPEQTGTVAGGSSVGSDSAGESAASGEVKKPLSPSAVGEEHAVMRMSDDASRRSVFANETWHRRLQIDRGMQCLLSLQEARHILDARGVNVQQFHSMNEGTMDPALAELRARTTTLLLELAALLGVTTTASQGEDERGGAMACDPAQLFRMLDTAKGRKLLSRALPLLHPSARFVLLPFVVEFMLGARTVGRLGAEANDDSDDRLCQALVLILLYHPPAPTAELLAECLRRALDGHNEQTLSVVLHNRARAEALQALLQRGGAAVQQLGESGEDAERVGAIKSQWEQSQGVFVALATAIKQTA